MRYGEVAGKKLADRIICYGDSYTWGWDPMVGGRYPDGIPWVDQLEEAGYPVINAGQPGRRVAATPGSIRLLKKHFEWNFPDTIRGRADEKAEEAPILGMTIMLGTNDYLIGFAQSAEEVASQMEKCVRNIKKILHPDWILLIAPPKIHTYDERDHRISEELPGLYQEIAKKEHLYYVDAARWNLELAMDGIHLSKDGNAAFAREMVKVFSAIAFAQEHHMPEVLRDQISTLRDLMEARPTSWVNPYLSEDYDWLQPRKHSAAVEMGEAEKELGMADIEGAEERLARFAPFLEKVFPEVRDSQGIIESELVEISKMKEWLNQVEEAGINGSLYLKRDSDLPIAGSVKARGGIYEVLKRTETLAKEAGLLKEGDSYEVLASKEARQFFQDYTIQVGSTGNLGLSIGIMSAAIGYHAIVHMSKDAKEWKKELLREHGVEVIEYESDYGQAVKEGRSRSDQDPKSYFVDDENSRDLYLGYAVAAKRLEKQLKDQEILVDACHPLFVYLPCGIGGAPGGITFGLKQVFGENVHCFFVEPTQAPCMMLGMSTGLHSDISVYDIGLSGKTEADGLAVMRPSSFVGREMEKYVSGLFTVEDEKLLPFLKGLYQSEGIYIEPSSCAAFAGPERFLSSHRMKEYRKRHNLPQFMDQATHIVWATGGSLVPESVRKEQLSLQ